MPQAGLPSIGLDRARAMVDEGHFEPALALLRAERTPAGSAMAATHAALLSEALLGAGFYEEGAQAAVTALDRAISAFGAASGQAADAWLLRARAELQRGDDPAETRRVLEQGLVAGAAVDGPDGLRALRARDRIALAFSTAGQPREAETLLRDIIAKAIELRPEPTRDRWRFVNTLGIALLRQSRFEEARVEFDRAREGRSRLLSDGHPETLESEHNAAVALRRLGQHEAATQTFIRVLTLRTEVLGSDHPDTLSTRDMLSRQFADRGDFAAAEKESRAVLEALTRRLGPHRRTIGAAAELGAVLYRAGRRSEGLKIYGAAFENALRVLGDKDIDTMALGHEYGGMLFQSARLPEALRVLNQVFVASAETLGDANRDTLATLNSIAAVLQELGRGEDAERLYRHIVSTLEATGSGRDNLDRLSALNNLASVLLAQGRYPEALSTLEEVVPLRTQRLGPDRSPTLISLSNQAATFSKLRRWPEAIALHRNVLAARERTLGPEHPETLRTLHNIASTYDEAGDAVTARREFERVVALRTRILGPTHPETMTSLRALAGVLYAVGDLAAARLRYRELVAAAETVRAKGALPDDLQRSLFAALSPAYRMLALIEAQIGRFEDAFEIAELSKARTILELTATRAAVRASVLTEGERFRLADIEWEVARLDNQIPTVVDPVRRTALEYRRSELASEFTRLQNELGAKYPRYSAGTEAQMARADDIVEVIPEDTAFLHFVTLGPRILLVWATGSGERGTLVLPDVPTLGATIEAYRAAVARPGGVEDLRYPPAGAQRQLVWQLDDGSFRLRPSDQGTIEGASLVSDVAEIRAYLSRALLDRMPDAVRAKPKWIVSPDGPLALLPFETLDAGGVMAVERWQMSSIQSLSMLKLLRDRGREYAALQREPLLAIGDPLYEPSGPAIESPPADEGGAASRRAIAAATREGSPGVKRWSRLPGAADELSALTRLFDLERGRTLYQGADASEQRVRSLDRQQVLGRFRYVVFSAHGDLDLADPRRSAIVLSQVGLDADSDGYLRAAELPAFTFRSDLVVVSACDSGVGSWVSGEGVLGLPFALYVAGNRSTVLTLWPIYDGSTAEFVERFFAKIKSGQSLGAALTATKREFARGDAGEGLRAPAFWAAFSLYGVASE